MYAKIYTLEDSYKYKGQRKRLVESLQSKGITDERVIQAMLEVPRHFFFPEAFWSKAYDDAAFPIEGGQTISQPFTVAFQTQLLAVKPGDRVLEIGTGSGYQAAVLSAMGAEVYSIERVEELFRSSATKLQESGYRVNVFLGDGTVGLPSKGPFDGIIVTAAAPDLAEHLKVQLNTGGRLVLPVGDQSFQKMVLIERLVDNKYRRTEHGDFKFVPLIGKYGWTN